MAGAAAAGVAARMSAWRVHAYGAQARLERARVPALRAPGDVLVRVHAASVNPLDVAMQDGYGAGVLNALRGLEGGGGGVELPLVVGRDFAGEVVAAGAAARLRRGQRVWGVAAPHRAGAHAQYVVAHEGWAGAAPARLDTLQAGGALYAALTACSLLRAAGLAVGAGGGRRARARVLLLGVGGVGQAALQLLRNSGAHVTVGCSGELCELARALGAAAALDRHAAEYEQRLEDAGPYEVILDCAGLGGEAAAARRWRYARYVTLTTPLLREVDARGVLAGALAAAVALARQSLAAASAAAPPGARAAPAPCPPPHVRWAYFAPRPGDIEMLRQLAERGELTVCVERAFPWWEGAAAYAQARRGGARGKLLLDFSLPPPPPHQPEAAAPPGQRS